MKCFSLSFTGTQQLADVEFILFIYRPLKSVLFRTCNFDTFINGGFLSEEKARELQQVFNTLSTHGRAFKNEYYFVIKSTDDLNILGQTLYHLEVPYTFLEPDITDTYLGKRAN